MSDDNQQIPNDSLKFTDIPSSSARWDKISEFALTFDGYKEHGSFAKCAEIANEQRHSTLTELRTCLFFEQRRWRHYGDEPDDEAMGYIKSIVEKIRTMVVNNGQSTTDIMEREIELFLEIVKEVSDGKILAQATDPLNVIFDEGLSPIEFELALYSLEASSHREIAQEFYEGAIKDHLAKPIGSFLREYLSKESLADPLFVTKVFKRFYLSAIWQAEEDNEPGDN